MTVLHRLDPAFVVLVATVVTFLQMFSEPLPTPIFDAAGYLNTAVNLDVYGVFSKTYAGFSQDPPPSDMFFAPLYPAFLAAMAKLSPDFSAYAQCVVGARGLPVEDVEALCPHRVNVAIVAQGALAVLSAVLVHVAARLVWGKRRYAWLAMILVLAAGSYADYATRYLTENWVFPVFTVATVALVRAWRKPNVRMWAAAGACLGVLALARPSFAWLACFLVLCQIACLFVGRSRSDRFATKHVAATVAGFVCVAGPWVARNWIVHDVAAISDGYASYILVQRVAYNAMTFNEWLVSWMYWFPRGNMLAASLFPSELYNRLNYHHPESFYRVGNDVLRAATLEAAGGVSNHLGHLLRKHVFADPVQHLLVTLPLMWRGGAYMFLLLVPALVWSLKEKRWDFPILCLPSVFMLVFYASVSVSVLRYNLTVLPACAVGASFALVWFAARGYGIGARLVRRRSNGNGRAGD